MLGIGKQLRTKLGRLRRRNEELRTRMEELEEESIHNEGVMVALREGYTEARARVKELEENEKDLKQMNADQANVISEFIHGENEGPTGLRFTPKMIDAAWATRVGDGDFISASKLNIFRCGGCADCDDPHVELLRERRGESIIRCNGHGWVIKKEKRDGMDSD